MKKQDIRNIYTQKVTELLNQGYTIFPDTMNGSQGEIAHIDLTNGSEILRVLLYREHHWERGEDGYIGDTVCLTVGKAAPDTRAVGEDLTACACSRGIGAAGCPARHAAAAGGVLGRHAGGDEDCRLLPESLEGRPFRTAAQGTS